MENYHTLVLISSHFIRYITMLQHRRIFIFTLATVRSKSLRAPVRAPAAEISFVQSDEVAICLHCGKETDD